MVDLQRIWQQHARQWLRPPQENVPREKEGNTSAVGMHSSTVHEPSLFFVLQFVPSVQVKVEDASASFMVDLLDQHEGGQEMLPACPDAMAASEIASQGTAQQVWPLFRFML